MIRICVNKWSIIGILVFIPIIFYAQDKNRGVELGLHREIPSTSYLTVGCFYQWQKWTGIADLEIPLSSSSSINRGGKLSLRYSLVSKKARLRPYLNTAVEYQNRNLSNANHKSYSSIGGHIGTGVQFRIWDDISIFCEAGVTRRKIYFDVPVSIWIPILALKVNYSILAK